jgi:hypothetical protein
MNDPEFILLLEQYLDGSITPGGRRELREAVTADPRHRRLFEDQARQHVRLHAQTSRVDFTESQRVAVMVMDVVEKEHAARFVDILRQQTIRERLQAIARGLRAPRDSGPHRYARFALLRIFGPPSVSAGLAAAIVLLLMLFAVPVVKPPNPYADSIVIEILPRDRLPVVPDEIPVTPPVKPDEAGGPATEGPPLIEPPSAPAEVMWVSEPSDPTRNGNLTDLPLRPQGTKSFTLPLPLGGRTEGGRGKVLHLTDGNAQTERAVTNALHWLKAHQLSDGSWAGQDPAAMTGLALLAYLAHGELPTSATFGVTVKKALDYLVARQDAGGSFSKDVYAHAIATYAIGEAFTLTRHMALLTPMERGVAVIVNGQQANGSYDYFYAKGTRFDTSVTGWQIQALKAARLAGSTTPGLDPALERSARFLKTEAFARDGSGFVYSGQPGVQPASGATWTMTGVGTLCLQMLGQARTVQARAGLRALESITFAWPRAAGEKVKLYGAYYVTQAKFQQDQKPVWKAWNQSFQPAVLSRQKPDGHWEGGDYDQGSHVYTTTLCTLMLEVYYRYLPTYAQPVETAASETAAEDTVRVDVR